MRPPSEAILSYSQNAEDVRLWRIFRDFPPGFYVDVGAAWPTFDSVTQLFYEHGWTGINIEPGPLHADLAELRPRDVNLRVAIGETDGTATLHVVHRYEGLSTTDQEVLRRNRERLDPRLLEEVQVPQRRLETILDEYAPDRRIDFLKIDVEGAERAVIRSSDWKRFRPTILVVEAITPLTFEPNHEEWEGFLLDNGYLFATFDGINRFYVEAERASLIEKLAYPVSVLDSYVSPSEQRALQRLSALQAEKKAWQIRAGDWKEREERLEELEEEVRRLRNQEATASRRARRAETRLRQIRSSRSWRLVGRTRRLLAPVRPAMRPVARFVRTTRGGTKWLDSRLARARRVLHRGWVVDVYRAALRSGRPWAFPMSHPAPREGPLTPLRRVLDTLPSESGLTETALDAAIDATGRHEESTLKQARLTTPDRDAIVQAEMVKVLRTLQGPTAGDGSHVSSGDGSIVVVDVRCLQDDDYRRRGVGRHGEHVLRSVAALFRGPRDLVLLIDPQLPRLAPAIATLGRSAATIGANEVADVEVFVELSPMTASPGPVLPLLLSPNVRSFAVVHDFIQLQYPDVFLATDTRWIAYRTQLEALAHYDAFLANSEATAGKLREVLKPDASVTVTGIADPFHGSAGSTDALQGDPPFARYVLVSSGAAPRKNLLAPIAAHTVYSRGKDRRLGLVVAGSLPDSLAQAAREFGKECGIARDRIVFSADLTDAELRALYANAEVVVVPSFAEGFSIPVAEAVSVGTPVVASKIDAHEELLGHGWWLVPPDDPLAMGRAIARALTEPDALAARQHDAVGTRFEPDAVAARITGALGVVPAGEPPPARALAPARAAGHRPRIAVYTPLPPQRTGVGVYSGVTLQALAAYADLVVYTDRRGSIETRSDAEITTRPYSMRPHLDGRYAAVISVLGNSYFHIPILEYFLEFGGPCIAHDPRMAELYSFWRGPDYLARLLSRHADIAVSAKDIPGLLADPDRLGSTVYDEIALRGRPMMVHSAGIARRVLNETGVEATILPYVPHRIPGADALNADIVSAARESLGWTKRSLHLVTFGIVDRRSKAVDIVVDALAWLRQWGLDCHLHIVGPVSPGERKQLSDRVNTLGVAGFVDMTGWVPDDLLEHYLLGADAAVQVRTFASAPLSGALLDCMAFGVPTVTTAGLAEEMQPPSFVRPVADQFSALLLAEAIEPVLERTRTDAVSGVESERRRWLGERTTDVYARRLLEALGLTPRPR